MSEVIYNRIAMLRAERGISRRQLSDALGVHYLALKLAQYFEVPVEVIFSTDPFPRIGTP